MVFSRVHEIRPTALPPGQRRSGRSRRCGWRSCVSRFRRRFHVNSPADEVHQAEHDGHDQQNVEQPAERGFRERPPGTTTATSTRTTNSISALPRAGNARGLPTRRLSSSAWNGGHGDPAGLYDRSGVQPMRVLFIGNSLTTANGLRGMVEQLASHGWRARKSRRPPSPPAVTASRITGRLGRRARVLRSGTWSAVVLQQGPSSRPDSRVLPRVTMSRASTPRRRRAASR